MIQSNSNQDGKWDPTRRSLLSRLKDWDDQESWRVFFNTYWKLIYSVALKAGLSDDEAQEVVQETVITVAKKMPDFKYDPATGSFKNWLLTTTKWRIADQIRKRQRDARLHEVIAQSTSDAAAAQDPLSEAAFSWDSVWQVEWNQAMVDSALERVKQKVRAKQYQMFDMHVVKQWPAHKVARKLKVSLARVYYAKYKITGLVQSEVKKLEAEII